jgi:hypothetical protein
VPRSRNAPPLPALACCVRRQRPTSRLPLPHRSPAPARARPKRLPARKDPGGSRTTARAARVRAAIPAAKSAAAAPSIAPLPPPATSCSAPSANPPSGRRSSMALMPNGNTARRCLAPPSRHRMRSRSASTTAAGRAYSCPLQLIYRANCSLFVLIESGVNGLEFPPMTSPRLSSEHQPSKKPAARGVLASAGYLLARLSPNFCRGQARTRRRPPTK